MMRIRGFRRMERVAALGLCAGAALLSACRQPSFAPYASPFGDFRCEAPWGWRVVSERAGADYSNVTFLGPFDPLFFRGAPSLSVRWYRLNAPHRLPDGTYESYSSVEDYARQMLRDVYGPSARRWAGTDRELAEALNRGEVFPETQRVRVSGVDAAYFVVYRDLPAPPGNASGVATDRAGHREILERHAYALVPLKKGFYALVYPATRGGFDKYKSEFFHLIRTFQALREGPAAPPAGGAAAPGRAPARARAPRRR